MILNDTNRIKEEQKMVSVQEEKNAFKCQMCDKFFSQKGNMKKHIASLHKENNKVKSEI